MASTCRARVTVPHMGACLEVRVASSMQFRDERRIKVASA